MFYNLLRSSAIISTLAGTFAHPFHHQRDLVFFNGRPMQHLLAFGDSYTFVQGTQGLWNFSFIADAFNYSYTPEQLLTDKIVKNTTSSGGANWAEYLTGCYEGLPSKCTGTKLWDFAFAGADISTAFLPLHHNYSVDLDHQVVQWDLYARPVLKMEPKDTLVAFWIGINDIGDSGKFTNVSFPEYYDTLVDRYFESVELVRSRGYQNFVFMLLPPLEKTPPNLISADPHANASQIVEFDAAISSHVSAFQKKHESSVQTFVFNTYSVLNAVLTNPAPYGIKNTTGYCSAYDQPDVLWNYAAYGCQPISEYFWFNTGHITYTVHGIIADELRLQIR